MARLPPPVTMITCSMPLAIASSTLYWMAGLSTNGSISFGIALVAGRKRVPRPAAVMIALRTGGIAIPDNLRRGDLRRDPSWARGTVGAGGGGRPHHQARRGQRHLLDAGHDRPHGGSQPKVGPRPAPG